PSAWTARAGAWTTSSSSGCGEASNTRRSTSTPMRVWPRPKPVLAPGSISTMRSASTRASAIARRGKFTRKAYGYVDDRLCRPAPLPPPPEPARKAGKCSPSPTYPQAPQPTKDLMLVECTVNSSNQPSRSPRSEPTSKPVGLHLKTRLRLSHNRGPPHIFLLGSGVWHSQALTAAPAEPQSDTPAISAAGAKYEHRLEMSRFEVG